MRECEIERKLVDTVKVKGGICWKFVSPGTAGVPDRIILICMRFGFTKNLVLPLPEPPITRIFLFLAYFGLDGLPIVKHSVCVRMTLLSLSFKSMYGSISFCSPHTAEPYSSP